jgi:hypothetical protein
LSLLLNLPPLPGTPHMENGGTFAVDFADGTRDRHNIDVRLDAPQSLGSSIGSSHPRLLRFWVKAPNTNSKIGTTRLARARARGTGVSLTIRPWPASSRKLSRCVLRQVQCLIRCQSQWSVCILNHHEGYIDRNTSEANLLGDAEWPPRSGDSFASRGHLTVDLLVSSATRGIAGTSRR